MRLSLIKVLLPTFVLCVSILLQSQLVHQYPKAGCILPCAVGGVRILVELKKRILVQQVTLGKGLEKCSIFCSAIAVQ